MIENLPQLIKEAKDGLEKHFGIVLENSERLALEIDGQVYIHFIEREKVFLAEFDRKTLRLKGYSSLTKQPVEEFIEQEIGRPYTWERENF